MTEKQTRVSLKGMSEEEKKEMKRVKHREYMANRRKQDPEFAKKQRELARKNMQEKRKNDEFNTKHREYCSEYNKKKKEQIQNLQNLFERFQKTCVEYPQCMVSLRYNTIWIQTKEGKYISENESTEEFVNRLNDIIEQFGNDKGCEVTFDYSENQIVVTKDGFPLFF